MDGTGLTSLVSGQNAPHGVAVDGSDIYWSNATGGTINKAPLTGGTATTLFTGQNFPVGVAVDSNNIYWPPMGRPPRSTWLP